jgi:pimeloyl-ACP methyl ester carboxylesterase
MPAFRKGPSQGTFRYLDAGAGFPFVFQHPLGEDVHDSEALCAPPDGIRLLSFDGRTRADEAQAATTLDDYGDDLIAFLDHLCLPTAIVGGEAMGAGVALNVAVRYPERVAGLVLSRPAWLDGPATAYVNDLYGRIARLLGEAGPTAARAPLRWSPRDRPADCLREAATIQVPTLILAHHQDPIHPFHFGVALARSIQGARLVRLTPTSVDRQHRAEEIQQAMADFLEWFAYAVPALEEVA